MATMELNDTMSQKAINYKKTVAGKFMLIEESKISSRVAGEDFCVTKKIMPPPRREGVA